MRLVALLVAAVALGGCGQSTTATTTRQPARPAAEFAGGELTPPLRAPPIALHDAHGKRITLASQRGRYVLVTFLYTHCPDVCPLIAQNLNLALKRLGPAREQVRVLAVSVDPKGDTAASVRAYEKRLRLRPQFHYLIGSRAELEKTWIAWRVQAVRSSPDVVDHVAYTALVDTRGKERLLYDSSVRAAQVVHDLRILLG